MAGEIQELFIKYQKKYPLYNHKALVDMMLEDGVITPEVAKEINSGTSLFLLDNSFKTIQNNAFTQDFTIKDVFGAKFTTTTKNNSTPPKNQYPLPYKFKIEKADDKNAYIIPSQFELPELQKTFNQNLFDIKKENNLIVITDKKTNKTVFKVETISDDYGSKNYNIYQYTDNKEIVTRINTVYDGQDKIIGIFDSKKVLNKDGSYTLSNFQYGTNLVSSETYYDKNDTEKWCIYYNNGRKYKKEYSDGKVENYLVNELIKDITAKTNLGLPTTRDSLKSHIEEMNWYQVGEVLFTYYETTGRDLISDINAEIGLPKKLRKELCEHIIKKVEKSPEKYDDKFRTYIAKILDKDINSNPPGENFDYHITIAAMLPIKDKFFNLYKEQNNGKDFLKEINKSYFLKNNGKKELFDEDYVKYYDAEGAKYLADLIDDDISGIGSGKLEKHIKLITPENVEQVLKSYTRPKVLGVNVEKILKFFNVKEDEYEYVATLEPLLTAIYSEYGLSEKKRYELMNHVFEQLKQYDTKKSTYYDDIIEDLNDNMTDSKKRPVDLMRLDNRVMRGRENRETSYWDYNIKQGGTGDCWLLAGVISILNKTGGDALLDKIVVKQSGCKSFTVNLKGVNKKIEVSYDEIRNMSHLASGNWKAIAIEIAVDKYLKEIAYDGKSSKVDINGNNTEFLYKLILGNGERCKPKDISDISEFNNPNKVYSIGFNKYIGDSKDKYPNLGEDENGNKVDISRHHAYAIKGSDKEYVYLINPWDSTAVIKVKWEDIKNLPSPKPDIYSATI